MGNLSGVSAVVPCFEEAAHLDRVVTTLTHVLERVAEDRWEILIVVSSAATDGTPQRAAALAQDVPGVRAVVQDARHSGYGGAVAQGIEAARHPWIFLTDGDEQLPYAELERFADAARGADLVIGRRAPRSDSVGRRVAGALYSRVVAWLFALGPVADVDCAFKLLRREIVGSQPLRSRTGAVNAELLVRARQAGRKRSILFVRHRPRAAGTARFEHDLGPLGNVPSLGETRAVLRDVAALALRQAGARALALGRKAH